MQPKNCASDHAESAKSPRGELGQIVARDVFDDLAPAAGQRAIGKRERNANNQIAQRPETQTQAAAVIRGEHAAHGGPRRPKWIKGQTLAVLGESFLQRLNGTTGSNGNGEVGPGVLRDFVEPCRGKDNVRARWWIPPAKFCAAAARDDRQPSIADKSKRFRKF